MGCRDPRRQKRNKEDEDIEMDELVNNCLNLNIPLENNQKEQKSKEIFSASVIQPFQCSNELNNIETNKITETKRKVFDFRNYLLPGKNNVIGYSVSSEEE